MKTSNDGWSGSGSPGGESIGEICRRVRARRGAVGWSLLYLIFGGGFVGAVVIYFVVKMLGG